MGSQRAKEETPQKIKEVKKTAVKKWKGKDWFVTLAPSMIGGIQLGEMPATDPKSLMGRNIEVSLPEIKKGQSKYYANLIFKVVDVKGSNAYTEFDGYRILREHVFRSVRKNSQKIDIVIDESTKDKWKLHLGMVMILKRNVNAKTGKEVRKMATEILKKEIPKTLINELMNLVMSDVVQKKIRKECSKIYPVRYCEISKIKVIKRGDTAKVDADTEKKENAKLAV